MIRGRRCEQWARSFHAAPWVSYAEALCWIFYRDVDAIAALGCLSSDRDYAELGSGMVEALLAMEAGADWQAAAPELELLDALEAGTVTASGHPFILLQLTKGTSYGRTARRDIQPIEWLDVRLYDAPAPFDKATTAYPKALPHGAKAAGGFTDIWFSRADLTARFPGRGANEVVAIDAPARFTIKDERDAKNHLVRLFRSSPNEPTMKNLELKQWLKKEMAGREISGAAFERAKAAAVLEAEAEAWARPGRPRGAG